MNVSDRRKKSAIEVLLSIVMFVFGYLLADKLSVHFLDLSTVNRGGIIYYTEDASFRWGSIFPIIGCALMALGMKHLVNFCNMWGTSVKRSYKAMEGTKLGIFALFVICLNVFTPSYFLALTEKSFKATGDNNAFITFEKLNLYIAFAFMGIILFFIVFNSLFKYKLKASYVVAALLAIVWSVFAFVIKTFAVKWLWGIYLVGFVLFGLAIRSSGDYYAPGVAFSSEDEEYKENIAFFVSCHGMGHIMRILPVIAHILKTTECNIVLVTGEAQMDIAVNYLENSAGIDKDVIEERCFGEVLTTDFGLAVKDGSLLLDPVATEEGVREYIGELPNNNFYAVSIIDKYAITKVVADIVPFALSAASFRRIPSILMANFTWTEIYQEYLSEELLKPYKGCFNRATTVFRYALCNPLTINRFPNGRDIGFVCRPFNEAHASAIREQVGTDKPIVYFSIGMSNNGIEGQNDVSNLPYTFITTEGVGLTGDNVHVIPKGCDDSQDYVLAADYCILKAGWSTISECMIAGKPMALLARDDIAEDRANVAMLVNAGYGIKIDVSEMADLGNVLARMESYEFNNECFENRCAEIAEEILSYH